MSRSMMEPFYENSEEPKADKGRELFSYIWGDDVRGYR